MKTPEMPFPQTPCIDCLADMKACIETSGGGLVVHCNHKDAGAVYDPVKKLWFAFSPISAEDFADAVLSDVMQQHGFSFEKKPLN